MQIKAEAKFLKHGPRKVRLVADLIRPMAIDEAMTTLKHLSNRSAVPVLKVLKQAVANAVNNYKLSKDSLTIQLIEVNVGPIYKRFQPVSRGRAHSILKRTSHIKIILESHGPKS
ncbi:50S ribosomal protein L22 [Patescibacteria group bacterium]|nr:50S ribosomal protein L22 [Patescibacteria group bacterium]MBU1499499.1 50S ribosomal protein L22 [Patescibacteria group bacterium]